MPDRQFSKRFGENGKGGRLGNHEFYQLILTFKMSEDRFVNDKRVFQVGVKLKVRFVSMLYNSICTTPGHQYEYYVNIN